MNRRNCLICVQNPAARGALCGRCVNQLDTASELCPEQVTATVAGVARACVVDRWGRAHAIGDGSVISRDDCRGGLAIRSAEVSRAHAEILERDGNWYLRDHGSRNGSFINGVRVQREQRLIAADLVAFSMHRFYFLIGVVLMEQVSVANAGARYETRTPPDIGPLTQVVSDAQVSVHASEHGRGGVVECGEAAVDLTELQFEFVALLAERWRVQTPSPVSGFVCIEELLTDLPWNSPVAGEPQLKSLVHRIRALLARSGLPNIIERRRDLGYRLTLPGGGVYARGSDRVDLPPTAHQARSRIRERQATQPPGAGPEGK